MDAANDGASAILKALLIRGADVAAQDKVSRGAAFRTSRELAGRVARGTGLTSDRHVSVCHNARWQPQFGNTPLLLAAAGGHLKASRLLLSHGAAPSVRNKVRRETFSAGASQQARICALVVVYMRCIETQSLSVGAQKMGVWRASCSSPACPLCGRGWEQPKAPLANAEQPVVQWQGDGICNVLAVWQHPLASGCLSAPEQLDSAAS